MAHKSHKQKLFHLKVANKTRFRPTQHLYIMWGVSLDIQTALWNYGLV